MLGPPCARSEASTHKVGPRARAAKRARAAFNRRNSRGQQRGSPRYIVNAADPSDVLLKVHYLFAGYGNTGAFGPLGLLASRIGGNLFALADFRKHTFDDWEDVELMGRGAFDFLKNYRRWGGSPGQRNCGK